MAENCLFCRIVAGEIPAQEVHRDEHVVAFRDIKPQAPHHVLVIPTRHAANLSEFVASASPEHVTALFGAVARLGAELGGDRGYRVVTNEGADAGQTVFHLHLHVLAGRTMHWPPG